METPKLVYHPLFEDRMNKQEVFIEAARNFYRPTHELSAKENDEERFKKMNAAFRKFYDADIAWREGMNADAKTEISPAEAEIIKQDIKFIQANVKETGQA